MNQRSSVRSLLALAVCVLFVSEAPLLSAIKNWALVAPVGSKIQDVPLADLVKFCKGSQKAWPDGKSFTLVMHDPESQEMRGAVQRLFGVTPDEIKPLLAKLNESHTIKVLEKDEDIMHAVASTPGAIGLVDVYAINSSVKVLRVDGKLPFDAGYSLKGN